MSTTRCLMLLLGFVGCWPAASAQDVALVATKGVQILGGSQMPMYAPFSWARRPDSQMARARCRSC